MLIDQVTGDDKCIPFLFQPPCIGNTGSVSESINEPLASPSQHWLQLLAHVEFWPRTWKRVGAWRPALAHCTSRTCSPSFTLAFNSQQIFW